jgi:hypothetical protein
MSVVFTCTSRWKGEISCLIPAHLATTDITDITDGGEVEF